MPDTVDTHPDSAAAAYADVGDVTSCDDAGLRSCRNRARSNAARSALPPLSEIRDAPITTTIVAHAVHALGYPKWAYENTEFAGSTAPLPPVVTVGAFSQIRRNIARHVADRYFFFRAARSNPQTLDSSPALAMSYAPTLLDGLRLVMEYANAFVPTSEFTIEFGDETIEWVFRPRVDTGELADVGAEINLDYIYRYVESRRGLDVSAAIVRFAHAPAGDAAAYREWLRCEIRFGAGRNSFCMPAEWARLPPARTDQGLWLLARERVLAECAALREPAKVRSVRAAIAARLARRQPPPRLKQVAAECGVSTRTLIRTLRLADTTFYELVDSARRAQAIEMIIRPEVPLAQIARDLGFPDRSSFGRRFRAWFGTSPARFRLTARQPTQA